MMLAALSHAQKISSASYPKVINAAILPDSNILKRTFKKDSTTSDDYQFLKKSYLPTLHFQDSLPRLPIPPLEKTCERYLRSQRALLQPQDYEKTKSYVQSFLKSDGNKTQKLLIEEDKTNKHTSYISKPWFDMYLSDRKPLPINYNPFLVFVNHENPEFNVTLLKATNLVISSLRFYKTLKEGILEPEVYHLNPVKSNTPTFRKVTKMLPKPIRAYGAYFFKAYPLDMSQYSNLFNTTRVPALGKDRIKHKDGKKHLMVMRRGHIYVFKVIDDDGYIVSPNVILSNLEKIIESDLPVAEHPVGVLTTEKRDVWAAARALLEQQGNSEVLDLIDSSLFNLVLDDEKPGTDYVNLIKVFLHADGVNRWFDKSFSLIVTGDGTAGVNFEHSWGDGVAVLRYFNEIHKDSTEKPRANSKTTRTKETSIQRLEFKLNDKLKDMISEAKKAYDKTCKSLEIRVVDYRTFGRQICKPLNISPDAMMQLSFQIAHDKLTGKQVATYESCSTAAFRHGRTETVRPCTLETKNVCTSLRSATPPSKAELQQMIVQCSKVHSQLIKEAAMGQGFDRHLFALKLKCEASGLSPAIFSDPAYAAINHNILSTSTLTSDNIQLGAFGPVVHDGFGVGYSIWSNRLGSIITTYKGGADGAGFTAALQQAFDTVYNILKGKS